MWLWINQLASPALSFYSGKVKTLKRTNPKDFSVQNLQSLKSWARECPASTQHGCYQGDSDLCCLGSHYSQGSRRNTQNPCGAEHMAWLKKCSPAQRIDYISETKTAGCSQDSQQNDPHLGSPWTWIMSRLSMTTGAVTTTFPWVTPPPTPALPHAFVKYQIACSSYWIMNMSASAYHQAFSSSPGELRRDGRDLQAKHKIEDKLELIICLFLYICFKIKCKLNKVVTELGKWGGAFLLQTADTSDFIISHYAEYDLQMCSPYGICENDFPERARRVEKQFHGVGWNKTSHLCFIFKKSNFVNLCFINLTD